MLTKRAPLELVTVLSTSTLVQVALTSKSGTIVALEEIVVVAGDVLVTVVVEVVLIVVVVDELAVVSSVAELLREKPYASVMTLNPETYPLCSTVCCSSTTLHSQRL